jgi:putative phosphoribosyl transferase
MYFTDRFQAGRLLAAELSTYRGREDVIVLALPRGGVAVGCEVAAVLGVALDILVVRKVGLPGYRELAIGSVASGGVELISEKAVERFQVVADDLQAVIAQEREEVARQERLFRGDRPFPELADRVAILVDDGLATGHTMKAAVAAVRLRAPREIVVAVPVGAPGTCRLVKRGVNQVICLFAPRDFAAVGIYYNDFRPVGDDEVRQLLVRAGQILEKRPLEAKEPLMPERN